MLWVFHTPAPSILIRKQSVISLRSMNMETKKSNHLVSSSTPSSFNSNGPVKGMNGPLNANSSEFKKNLESIRRPVLRRSASESESFSVKYRSNPERQPIVYTTTPIPKLHKVISSEDISNSDEMNSSEELEMQARARNRGRSNSLVERMADRLVHRSNSLKYHSGADNIAPPSLENTYGAGRRRGSTPDESELSRQQLPNVRLRRGSDSNVHQPLPAALRKRLNSLTDGSHQRRGSAPSINPRIVTKNNPVAPVISDARLLPLIRSLRRGSSGSLSGSTGNVRANQTDTKPRIEQQNLKPPVRSDASPLSPSTPPSTPNNLPTRSAEEVEKEMAQAFRQALETASWRQDDDTGPEN